MEPVRTAITEYGEGDSGYEAKLEYTKQITGKEKVWSRAPIPYRGIVRLVYRWLYDDSLRDYCLEFSITLNPLVFLELKDLR